LARIAVMVLVDVLERLAVAGLVDHLAAGARPHRCWPAWRPVPSPEAISPQADPSSRRPVTAVEVAAPRSRGVRCLFAAFRCLWGPWRVRRARRRWRRMRSDLGGRGVGLGRLELPTSSLSVKPAGSGPCIHPGADLRRCVRWRPPQFGRVGSGCHSVRHARGQSRMGSRQRSSRHPAGAPSLTADTRHLGHTQSTAGRWSASATSRTGSGP